MNFRFTREADADLRAIYHYTLKTWGRAQTLRYIAQLKQCCAMLASNPRAGRARSDLLPEGLHDFTQGNHVIFYLPELYSGILIIRILHTRQDLARHFENIT